MDRPHRPRSLDLPSSHETITSGETRSDRSSELHELLARGSQALLEYLRDAPSRQARVVKFAGPAALRAVFRDIGADIGLADQAATPREALLRALDETLRHAVRTQHPRFYNQNFAGADPIAVLGDWVAAAVNTTGATYEMAPVFTLMERALVERMGALAGFDEVEGLLCPGGSSSNLHALQLARHRVAPEVLERGAAAGAPLVAFTSAHAHYSLRKAAGLMGLGSANMITIAVDERGRMRPDALADAVTRARADGKRPFFVNATAGTTVLGAIDPIAAIARVAADHDLWLHVDGCHGASLLFSAQHRGALAGVARADSLAWNLHKMMGATQQCAMLLTRHPGSLRGAFAARADYLFQRDKNHASLDLGDMTFHCGRRVDSFKAWLLWKFHGDRGLARRVERVMALADQVERRVKEDPRFAMVAPRSCSNVCFWWLPPELRPLTDPREPAARARLHAITRAIKDRMQREGTLMLGYQAQDGLPNFFRLLVLNPAVTEEDLEQTLQLIDRYGADVSAGLAG